MMISDCVNIDNPGTLTLIWDNTYSKLTAKTLFCRFDVVPAASLAEAPSE